MSEPVTTRRAREDTAAVTLENRGVMVFRPEEGNPLSDAYDCWGVCVGSHGGYAKTLKGAMQRCLRCCDIGDWWRVNPPKDGELLYILFERATTEHALGKLCFARGRSDA